jgi:RND family efflux transporter MFP subunit
MRHAISLVAVFLTGLLGGCTNRSTPGRGDPATGEKEVLAAPLVHPQRKSLRRSIDQPGIIQGDEETPLYAKLAGFVKTVSSDIGDRVEGPALGPAGKEVKPGTLLAEIAIPELVDEAKQKKALQKQAEAEVKQARQLFAIAKENTAAKESQVAEAKAGMKRAQADYRRWQTEWNRIDKMVREKAIDPQVGTEKLNQFRAAEAARDEASARIVSAEANFRKSKAERDKAEDDIALAQAKLKVATAEADRLASLLQYRQIRAPFSGIIAKRNADTGHFVQPAGGAKAEPLFTVVKLDTVRVIVKVPEADAALIHKGASAAISVPALQGTTFKGQVSRMSGALDNSSRTLRTEIDLPNSGGKLRPGMFVDTRITVALPERWVLPVGALAKVGDAMVCYQMENGKAVRTEVQVGRGDGSAVEVLKKRKPRGTAWENWTGKEVIVGANAVNLTEGQEIRADSRQ